MPSHPHTKSARANVCLILEGTYPYVAGGVSSWVHELIREQSHLTFSLVTLVPPNSKLKRQYEIPKNVVGIHTLFIQDMPKGKSWRFKKKLKQDLYTRLAPLIENLIVAPEMKDLEEMLAILKDYREELGTRILLNSEEAWEALCNMYLKLLAGTKFIDFFWSWRQLASALYSILIYPMPDADCYHSLCTGYGGLFLARAHLDTGKPCLLTEHGIYTNERRIEISSASWLDDQRALSLNVDDVRLDKTLKDLWLDSFMGYSRLCYESCALIITLFEGNHLLQIEDGANPEKLRVIPNGVDYEKFSSVKRDKSHPPTVALIGRVVPIKDVKTFIRAGIILKSRVPDLRVWIIGPTDEDPDYFSECAEMIQNAGVQEVITFTGKVRVDEYLGKIDVIALTSLSESQPLVILEAGSAGVPSVATNVGSCQELIYGRNDEDPPLGDGGIVCSLSSPIEVATAMEKLLTDPDFYDQCARTMRERVERYYNKIQQHQSYRELYASYLP
ncbi:MAG: GT4 family glycosyltransferase PelF [SAR324 cluster bacterium]|nr:GT4 family glycosyltransferase PelF [SAR324 cluster bacterium]